MKSITLSAQEETVLRQLYNNYTQVLGPQISGIPLPFFLQFVWSRNLINNGFSFPLIRDIFYEAAGQGIGGESGFGGEFLTQAKFYNAIMLIAERLFTQDPMPINSLFTKILIESDIPEDEETLQLLSDEAIDVYIETSPGFRSLMVAFNSENINARSVVAN